MLLHFCVILLTDGGLHPGGLHPGVSASRGVSIRGVSIRGVSIRGVFMQGESVSVGLCIGGSLHPCIQGGLHRGGGGSASRRDLHPGGWADPLIGYYGIRSTSGWYTSYWNVFFLGYGYGPWSPSHLLSGWSGNETVSHSLRDRWRLQSSKASVTPEIY